MSAAKKCDKCGSFYEKYNQKDSSKATNGFMFLNIDTNGRYFSHDGIDLCPKCMNELLAWWKEGAENENANRNSGE